MPGAGLHFGDTAANTNNSSLVDVCVRACVRVSDECFGEQLSCVKGQEC